MMVLLLLDVIYRRRLLPVADPAVRDLGLGCFGVRGRHGREHQSHFPVSWRATYRAHLLQAPGMYTSVTLRRLFDG